MGVISKTCSVKVYPLLPDDCCDYKRFHKITIASFLIISLTLGFYITYVYLLNITSRFSQKLIPVISSERYNLETFYTILVI